MPIYLGAEYMEHRHEPRKNVSFVVTINGRDKDGHFFNEQVVASRISKSGALLSGLSRHVRLGDVISVAYGGKKSRFKVVWLRDSESHHLIQAGCRPPQGRALPMGEVLITGTGLIGYEQALYLRCRQPEQF
jgi:hypothetical protein